MSRATELDRVLVTQDDDFLGIAAKRQTFGTSFAGLVYGHQLKTGIGQMVEDLALIATCMSAQEIQGRVIYVPFH